MVVKMYKVRFKTSLLLRSYSFNISLLYGGIKMNKTELIAAVAEKSNLTKKDAEKAINAALATIEEALKASEKVSLVGFGTFEVVKRAARKGINPRTKESIKIKASKAPKFKAGKALKDAIN